MSDSNNGYEGSIRQRLADLQLKARERKTCLLADMTAAFPALRRFLIGGTVDGKAWPAGGIQITCESACVRVTLRIPNLGLEAIYTGIHAGDVLELIENDLDTDATPWDLDWSTRKQQKEKLQRSLRGS